MIATPHDPVFCHKEPCAECDRTERIVAGNGKVVEVNDASQRLFATMLMRLTELAFETMMKDGKEGMAALHGAMMYLASGTKLPPEILARSKELAAWAETCGLAAM